MGTKGKLSFLMIMLACPAMAQNLVTTPAPAMSGPAYDVSVGYTYLAMPIPGARQVPLQGLDASGSIAWNPRWAATVDTNYLRAADVPGTAHQAYLLNIQSGPQFCLFEHRNTRFSIRALAGAGLIDGAAPNYTTGFYHGWLVRPSIALGGGVEHALSGLFAIRINGDYLRTSFYNPNGRVLPQNNLRLTVGFVLHKRTAGSVARAW